MKVIEYLRAILALSVFPALIAFYLASSGVWVIGLAAYIVLTIVAAFLLGIVLERPDADKSENGE